ncbi:MAG: metallophosphoesterase family protein [Oscillospiraceae bacterium]|nr:metallophosphoesterase family protein [Oscillospiraceae bacterium]
MLGFKIPEERRIEWFCKKAARWDPFEIRRFEEFYKRFLTEKAVPEKKKLGLKLIVISDTHGYLAFDKSRFPTFMDTVADFDLCLLLGDVTAAEMPVILDCIPREKILAIKGNHDAFDIYSRFGVQEISGRVCEYQGVRFAGLDGSFRYKKERFPSHTQYESLQLARAMPEADVLLSHDVMLSDFYRDPAHSGLIGITYYVFRRGVQWHFHGHIHKSYERCYENGTREKSVYQCEYIEI